MLVARHWIDRALRLLSLLTPFFLGLSGAAVTLWTPDTNTAKAIWLGIFALLCIAGMLLAEIERKRSDRSHRQLLRHISGGDCYCYLTFDPDRQNSRGEFYLTMTATGPLHDVNYWISPAAANRNHRHPDYYRYDRRKPHGLAVHKGVRLWDGRLPPGEWIVEFDATNGLLDWVEYLTVTREDHLSTITQEVRVVDGKGKIVFSDKTSAKVETLSPPPPPSTG